MARQLIIMEGRHILSGDPTRVGDTTVLGSVLPLSGLEIDVSVNEGEDGSEEGVDSDGEEDAGREREAGVEVEVKV